MLVNREKLEKELAEVLTNNSIENQSNTPDFILACYLVDCLIAFERATNQRWKWYGGNSNEGEPQGYYQDACDFRTIETSKPFTVVKSFINGHGQTIELRDYGTEYRIAIDGFLHPKQEDFRTIHEQYLVYDKSPDKV